MRCSAALLVGGVVLLLAASAGWAGQKDLEDQKGRGNLCPMDFEATVHYGPDTNVSLKGTLYVARHGDEGTVDGTLADEAGFSVPVHGQILGRAANLLFDLGDDAVVYGTGTVLSSRDPDGCTTYKGGGTLTGPDPADVGSWLIIPIKGSIGLTPTCPGHISVTIAGPGVFEVGDPPQRVLQVKSNNACISTTNSAVTIGNPSTTAISGPFTLQLDMATGQFIAFIGEASFPDNQCRTLTFNNFVTGLKLGPVTVCLPIPPGTSFKFG